MALSCSFNISRLIEDDYISIQRTFACFVPLSIFLGLITVLAYWKFRRGERGEKSSLPSSCEPNSGGPPAVILGDCQ